METTGLERFTATLLEIVLPTLATVIGTMVVGLLTKYLQKAQIDLSSEQRTQLRRAIEEAVLAVEESTRRQRAAGRPLGQSGDAKAEQARRIAQDQVGQELDPAKVRPIIDAAVHRLREEYPPS